MKSFIVSFFTFILLGYIVLPSIISLVGNSNEIAVIIDINEEEEKKEETKKDFEIKINTSDNKSMSSEYKFLKKDQTILSFDRYSSKHSEVNTPPPKVVS